MESIQKVDDYGIDIELLRKAKKIKESLRKFRVGPIQKLPFNHESSHKENTRYLDLVLDSEEESETSMTSLNSVSDNSSEISKQQAARKSFVRGNKNHFTSKFSESVQPFLPPSRTELQNMFLNRFPNCEKESELWCELIKKV